MSPIKTEIPFKNTLDDVFTLNKTLHKNQFKSIASAIVTTVIKILLLFFTAYGSLVFFKNYYFLRNVVYRPITEAIGHYIMGVFLAVVFFAGIFYFTALRNFKTKHRYRKNPYKNRTKLLTVNNDGIAVSTVCSSSFFSWDKITLVTESANGIIISVKNQSVFIPSRFISSTDIVSLRKFFTENVPIDKIKFISRVHILETPEACEPFELINLEGCLKNRVAIEDFDFKDYFYNEFSRISYFNPDFRIIFATVILFIFLLSILTAQKILTGILCFVLMSVFLLAVVIFLLYMHISDSFNANESHSLRITFYDNALFIETKNSYLVLEYKNIISLRETPSSITVIGNNSVFRISRDNTRELESIKEIIKIKTINNKLTFLG